jgi:hypothetical protein
MTQQIKKNDFPFQLIEKSNNNSNKINKIELNNLQSNIIVSDRSNITNFNTINANNNVNSERSNNIIYTPKENLVIHETTDDTNDNKNNSNIEKIESAKKKTKLNMNNLQEKNKLIENNNANENKFIVIKKEEKKKKKIRTDHYGNEIKHQNKQIIKVTFADEIYNRPLEEVINIQSIKEFNIVYGMPKERDVFGKNKSTCCSCLIL